MIKNFIELQKIQIKITKKPTFKWNKALQKYEEQKDKSLDTLSWSDCLSTLYANGAEKVTFENIPNEKGGLVYEDVNGSLSIKVYVDIDGDRREIFFPIIDGATDVKADKVTQSDIYNAKQRAFVKCVAVNWGLGLSLWQKEEDPDKTEKDKGISFQIYFREAVNSAVKKHGGVDAMLDLLARSGEILRERDIKDLINAAGRMDTILKVLSNDQE